MQVSKNSLAGLLLLASSSAFAQATVHDQFAKIGTIQQAQQYVEANPNLKPALLNLNAAKDTTLIDKRLLRHNKGDIFSVGYVTYKVLDATESVKYRSSYIFLDGSTLSPTQVDSMKKIIVTKASVMRAFILRGRSRRCPAFQPELRSPLANGNSPSPGR